MDRQDQQCEEKLTCKDELTRAVREELEMHSRIDVDSHAQQHLFLQELIEEKKRKREQWQAVKSQFLGWGAIAMAAWIGKLIAEKLHL